MKMLVPLSLIICFAITNAEITPGLIKKSHTILRRSFLDKNPQTTYYIINEGGESPIVELKRRQKRSSEVRSSNVSLEDNHGLLAVHWAGEGSDVMIALARDPELSLTFTSNLYISHDYGRTFKKQQLLLDNGASGAVYWFYVNPVYNTHYVFTDLLHKVIWTTSDSGQTFTRMSFSFAPIHLTFHPTEWTTLVAYEYKDDNYALHISTNFAASWRLIHSSAKAFFWGSLEYKDNVADVFIHSVSPSYVIKHNYVTHNSIQLLSNIEYFQQSNEFLMGIKKLNVVRSSSQVSELWVSTNRLDFRRANLPGPDFYKEMLIADASEHQIFLCASINNSNIVHLYASDTTGLYFSLSLENIVYYNPSGINNNTWLKNFVFQPFVDLHKVEGLNGVYIATKFINISSQPSQQFANNNQVTMVTFNKGGDWRFLPSPSNSSDFYCLFSPTCNLHLTPIYYSLIPSGSAQPILTSKSAPGLIIASGKTGTSIGNSFDIYLSSNGGLGWRKVLNGTHHFTIGDHGGIVVAIQMNVLSNYIVYSLDEGQSWATYEFSASKMRVYGLSTEPGEETGVFTVFGSNPDQHGWIILQINLTTVFSRSCEDSDYTTWIPTDNPKVDCLLGCKMVYEKRKPLSICYNGRDYDRAISVENCPCKIDDYECDYGFVKNTTTTLCQRIFTQYLPYNCFDGDLYNMSKGYRKVPMDTCEGGLEDDFNPVLTNCPVAAFGEFIIFSNTSSLYRFSFSTRRVSKIQLRNIGNVVATTYNYASDCLYFADNQHDNIQVICLRGSNEQREQRVLITENMDRIESLFFNWASQQLFWVDAGHKKIESLNLRNFKRKVLVTNLTNPMSIALHPYLGYMFWSDWSENNPRIHRSNILGTNITVIINSSKLDTPLKWPNGLSVDDRSARLYFVDAGVNKLFHCDFNGNNCECIQLSTMTHPFSTTIFKETILWTDPTAGVIYTMSRLHGNVPVKLLEGFPNVLDVHAHSVTSQQVSSSCRLYPCFDVNALCFELNATSRQCKCEEGFQENSFGNGSVQCTCPDGTSLKNNSCVTEVGHPCPGEQFTCNNLRCIPLSFVCDRDNDCSDFSDEFNCSFSCAPQEFQCWNGRCIPSRWLCDGDNDCRDMSDEDPINCRQNTQNCSSAEFQCASGRCIPRPYVCDVDDDCHDGSDELNCTYYPTTPAPILCSSNQFSCKSRTQCILTRYKCDNDLDCLDGSDEEGCPINNCSVSHVLCKDGVQCILSWKLCDGFEDCTDGSDESNCSLFSPSTRPPWTTSSQCSSEEFKCRSSSQCIPLHEVCDGVINCIDRSDELSCSSCNTSTRFLCGNGACITKNLLCNQVDDCGDNSDEIHCEPTFSPPLCLPSSLRCSGIENKCIPESWICDGESDCPLGEDEGGCPNKTVACGEGTFACLFSRMCINETLVCDGHVDCLEGSDELNCNTNSTPTPCSQDKFECRFGGCIDLTSVCNSRWDCVDASDETNCSTARLRLSPIVTLVDVTYSSVTFRVTRLNDSLDNNVLFSILSTLGTYDWSDYQIRNSTVKTSNLPLDVTMTKLRPNVKYILSVSISINQISSDPVLKVFTTPSRVVPIPTPPLNLTITTSHNNRTYFLLLSWQPPSSVDPESILQYKVEYRDLSDGSDIYDATPQSVIVFDTSFRFSTNQLILGHKYKFQVFAKTSVWSSGSETKEIQFGPSCIDAHLSLTAPKVPSYVMNLEQASPRYPSSVHLFWNVSSDLDVYIYKCNVVYLQSFGELNEFIGEGEDLVSKSFKVADAALQECQLGSSCSTTINGLSSGSTYSIEMTAEAKNSSTYPSCHENKFIFHAPGIQPDAPVVRVSVAPDNEVHLNVSFVKLFPEGTEVTLRVIYIRARNKVDDVMQKLKITKDEFYLLNIGQLSSCDYFCFYSQIIWPFRSPMSLPDCVNTVNTKNRLEAPKDVRVVAWYLNGNKTLVSAIISWSPPCDSEPMTYFVLVQLMNNGKEMLNKGFIVKDEAGLSLISFRVDGLIRGSTYKISVRRDLPLAQMSQPVYFLAAPYPSPTELTYQLVTGSESTLLILSWSEPSDLPPKYEYEVYHSTTYRLLGETVPFEFFGKTDKSLLIINKLEFNIDHSFKVRLKCSTSNVSGNFSDIINVHIPGLSANTQPSRSNEKDWKVLVSVLVATGGVCLLSLVGVYLYRHKKLRISFDRLTNNRLHSEPNRAIFRQLGDDDDEELLINTFSDDDPLIEA